jgi:hypothetical protein
MFERIWIFLHVATVFAAVAVSVVPEFLMHRMAASGDVSGVRSFGRVYQQLGTLIPVLFGIGAVLGILAAVFNHLDLLQPWLLIAYVMFVIATILGAGIQGPWAQRLGKAAFQSQGDTPSAEFTAIAHDDRARMAMYAVAVIILLFILDMVFKPFTATPPQF